MTELFLSLKKEIGNKPALVLSRDALYKLLTTNFKTAAGHLKGKSVPTGEPPGIEARFTKLICQVERKDFELGPSTSINGAVAVELVFRFSATIALHVKDKPELEFSTISINEDEHKIDLNMDIVAYAPNLQFRAPDFALTLKSDITPSEKRKDALEQGSIKEDVLTQVESAMTNFMPHRFVRSAFSTISSIDLTERFTAFELHGDWSLRVIDNNLVILPSGGISIREDIGCSIKDSAPNLLIKADRIDNGPSSASWALAAQGESQLKKKKKENHVDEVGFAALYAPKPIWETHFAKVRPAVVYREHNNGFIGYDLSSTVALNYAGLDITTKPPGIVIDFKLVASGNASLTVDVPCVGRSELASAHFSCKASDLRILLSFVLEPSGKLLLESEIKGGISIGDVDAKVSTFTRWLALAGGKAAVVGFLVDQVLAYFMERNLPNKIRDTIKREVNSKNFELLDLEELAMFAEYKNLSFNGITFSGDKDSVLVGLGSFG